MSDRTPISSGDPAASDDELVERGRAPTDRPWLEVVGSRYLLDWLAEQRISLAFSTYQTGKLFFVGRFTPGGE